MLRYLHHHLDYDFACATFTTDNITFQTHKTH